MHIDVLVFTTEVTRQAAMKAKTPVGVTRTWVKLGFNLECDTSAGEKYILRSPGKGSSLEQCKESCQTATGCKSITFFNSGWCSHFSTLCTKTKWKQKAVSHRWSATSDMITTPTGQFALYLT